MIGPVTPFSQFLHGEKYCSDGEIFDGYALRLARNLSDNDAHFRALLDILRIQSFLPAGRIQISVGRNFQMTSFNCFVGNTIPDSMIGIFNELKNGAMTLRQGGGIGWDFSTLRPSGDLVKGLGFKAYSSGPVSFMHVWNATSNVIWSAGHRRGAMMAVLRVDHPDIRKFINAKGDQKTLKMFNLSIAITDKFMQAMIEDKTYDLVFNNTVYETVRARDIWAEIMQMNWDWAEPGLVFIDQVNRMNPLFYCEILSACNPCGEQFLPPYGACLLGSMNITKYVIPKVSAIKKLIADKNGAIHATRGDYEIDYPSLARDISTAVTALDNVIDISSYPLEAQKIEAFAKRRIGLGVTGMANALEICGHSYGSEQYIEAQDVVLETLRNNAYMTSIQLAKDKGQFPLFNQQWLDSGYSQTLPKEIRKEIANYGLRNGLLLSIAPTGTISLAADNCSSGLEPPYAMLANRKIITSHGEEEFELQDYADKFYGVKGLTAYEVTADEHIAVLVAAQKFIDNAVSKTCNVNGKSPDGEHGIVSFDEFKDLYIQAWQGGAKGCTTFNVNGKRIGILESRDDQEGGACVIDAETGGRSCDG